jgi:valyl-tRNA synthetase
MHESRGLRTLAKPILKSLNVNSGFHDTRNFTAEFEKTTNAINLVSRLHEKKPHFIDWAKSLDWDWVISRQRLFGYTHTNLVLAGAAVN